MRAKLPGGDVATVREAVDVAMRIGDTALAESLLAAVHRDGEANAADLAWALGALATFREAAGDLAHAVELKRRAARIAEPDVARRLEFEAARIAADKLGDSASAAEIYEALRGPTRRTAKRGSHSSPCTGVSGDARRLADLLGAVVEYVDDMGERGRLRLERVRTMVEGLGLDDAQARLFCARSSTRIPSQLDAALMLAAVLERTGDNGRAGVAPVAPDRRGEGPGRRTLGRVSRAPPRSAARAARPRRGARRLLHGPRLGGGQPALARCAARGSSTARMTRTSART